MEDMNSYEQGEAFNMGIATLMRFDKLLTLSCTAAIAGKYYEWYQALLQLRRNLKPFLKDDEWKSICDTIKDFPKDAWVPAKAGATNVRPNRFQLVYSILDKLDMLMQQQMKDHGLLMPKKNDPGRALLG